MRKVRTLLGKKSHSMPHENDYDLLIGKQLHLNGFINHLVYCNASATYMHLRIH